MRAFAAERGVRHLKRILALMKHREITEDILVNAVRNGPGPRVHHVRDQERLIRLLPVHALVSTHAFESVAVTLDQFIGTITLLEAANAHPMKAPDTSVQGWEWENGGSLLLMPFASDGLPGLEVVSTRPASQRVLVADHPMELVAYGDTATTPLMATIEGFLCDTLKLTVIISASTAAHRTLLIAAATTLKGCARGV